VSQLIDTLRRHRAERPHDPPVAGDAPAAERSAAQADAVLAILGYHPPDRLERWRWFGLVLLLAAFAALGWFAWPRSVPPPLPDGQPQVDAPPVTKLPVVLPTSTAAPPTAGDQATAAVDQPRPPRQGVASAAVPPGEKSGSAAAPPTRRTPTREPTRTSAANHLQLALYYHRSGDFERALVHYRSLLEQNELNAQAHNNLGVLYRDKGLLEEAVREFRRAVIIDQRYASARNNLGAALLGQGKLDEAAAEFRTVLETEPRNVDALVNQALVESAAGQTERAKASLLRALAVDARHPMAHYNLAVTYEETGEAGRAIDHYQAFLEMAGPAHAGRAPAVRARLDALAKR
jgi:tetratricopeptide (TPR) repeat protein